MVGWNGSGQRGGSTPVKPKATAKKPSPVRGLVAGGLVIILAIIAYFVFFSASEKPQTEKADKERGLIKEVTPAAAPTNKVVEAKEKPKDPHAGMRLSSNGVWQPANRPYRAGRKYVHGVVTNRRNRFNNGVTRGAVEQVMLQIFSRERGDMPLPLPDYLPEAEMKRLTEILIDKHEITEKDSEDVKISKEILNVAKSEMQKYIKEGGEPEDFLVYYHEELERSFYARKDAELYVQKLIRDGESADFISQFVDKTNEKLEAQNIKPINKPQEIEEAVSKEESK